MEAGFYYQYLQLTNWIIYSHRRSEGLSVPGGGGCSRGAAVHKNLRYAPVPCGEKKKGIGPRFRSTLAGGEIRFVTRSPPPRDSNFVFSEPMQIPPRCIATRRCWEKWIPASLTPLPPSILHPGAMLLPWGCPSPSAAWWHLCKDALLHHHSSPSKWLDFKCPFSGRQKNRKSPGRGGFRSHHRWGSQLVAWERKGFSLFLEQ